MSPESKLHGRLTVGSSRISIGHAPAHVLMTRVMGELQKIKHREDMVIQIEMSPARLPDATSFNRVTLLEQELAAKIITDAKADSPFPGISVGRVVEVMGTKEYEAYESICKPDNRIGLTEVDIDTIRDTYRIKFNDCFPYFPQWVD